MDKLKVKLGTTADRIEKFVTNVVKTGKEKRTDSFLNARLQLLETYWTQYLKLFDELCDLATEEQLKEDAYFTSDTFYKIEGCYVDAASFLNDEIKCFRGSSTTEESPLNSTVISSPMNQAVKLPQINIPNFSGSYLEWPSFRDTYTSLIHDNNSLSQVQRMYYLKSSVTGDASKLLQHLSLTEANYNAAWKILADRYDNTRVLVTTNLSALVSLPAMSTESAAELRRVLDTFMQSVRALENLSRPVQSWNDWLVFFLSHKLDNATRKDWETSLSSSNRLPSLEELRTFLESRIHTLNSIKSNKSSTNARNPNSVTRGLHATASQRCSDCQKKHFIMFCPQFRARSVDARMALVNNKQLCSNCLRTNHSVSNCSSNKRCRICHEDHHTMLHKTSGSQPPPVTQGQELQQPASDTSNQRNSSQNHTASVSSPLVEGCPIPSTVLLPTAMVFARSADGRLIKARALLDQGSESNFITASLANLLRLPKQRVNISVTGIGASETGIVQACVTHDVVSAVNTACSYSVHSLVMPTLTQLIPSQPVHRWNWSHVSDLTLADPDFYRPAPIDLILGAEVYSRVLCNELRQGPPGTPIAQNTGLGWILSGSVDTHTDRTALVRSCHTSIVDLDATLKRFWEVEEPPKCSRLTPEEEECENLFANSHYRNEQGQYIVRLPLKQSSTALGQSRKVALSALLRMENRFTRDLQLQRSYSAFMDEYLRLDHMSPAQDAISDDGVYYLPHHAVVKPSSSTTKLRVVFNASQKTSSGLSLNDLLHTGPKLQNDVISVILRWRVYPFVFSADIEKMFRQILVDERDMDLQRILWRDSPSKPVKEFKLRTVTYGTACAPYLACKTQQQLAEDYRYKYPKASQTIRENFYVDDALFGAFDMPTALKVRDELRQLLQLGHFNLRKWISNSADLLEGISENDREVNQAVQVLSDPQIKALGINWNPEADQFCFHVDLPQSDTITKRTVLSDISRLYDPLGWLSPVIVSAKIFLQRLWLERIDWDETLPDELSQRWFTLKQSLTLLNDIRLDRWLGTSCQSHQGWELHGYCDASLAAYGAVIYLRVPYKDQMKISLLAAKTRVSPIATVSLPRLELCGAALLADLARYLQQALQLTDVPLYLWTDSTVVLAWLREHPSKWNVFVANRVSQIHQLVPEATWLHIASSENPADCISRGLAAEQLKDFDLWWLGPSSLREPSSTWSRGPIPPTDQELRPSPAFVTQKPQPTFSELLHRYSSLCKLLRVSALCLRFFTNLSRARGERIIGCLTMEELNNALITWIRLIQRQSFPEFDAIAKDQPLPSSSRLLKLRPFLDQQGILRVSGRLKESLLCYDEKHPIILPKEGHLTYLIILNAHTSTLHGGVQHTLHHIRAKYWILSGRSEVRKTVRKCVTCCRHGAKTATQVMGDLPPDRVRPSKPFSAAGVDYAGPFFVTPVRRRGCKTTKAYVAVFVCFVTRALHLELVMDLTAEAFIAAFKRFVSRRGRCERLYSDNATYFTAANKRLVLDYTQLKKETSHATLDMGTDWHFMPPAAPHFGGIWESGVRCFKHHLRRVVSDHSLSVEEMLTLIAQIECCLNSRPLYSLSDDPADLSAITPGHFLVGEVLHSVPAPSLLQTPIQRLNRWDFVQRMYEDLWKRWYKDYIHHLQVRNKWTQSQRSMEVNDLVLIKDERLPPSKWLMGRVTEVQPGDDGYVRVARVRHKDGSYKRPITKLCLLPLQAPAEA